MTSSTIPVRLLSHQRVAGRCSVNASTHPCVISGRLDAKLALPRRLTRHTRISRNAHEKSSDAEKDQALHMGALS